MHFNRTLPPILLQTIQLDQANNDGDAEGDVCDDDDDNDGLSDVEEESFDGTPGYNPGTDTDPFNADTDGDLLVCLQFVLRMKDPTSEDLAHADLYPAGAPDGEIGLSDFIQLQQLVFFQTGATGTIPAIAPVYRVYTDATLPDPAAWPATAIITTGE